MRFGGFWSYFFPYESKRQLVAGALDAIVTGDCRLAIHTQLRRVVRRVLEQRSGGRWQTLYTEYSGFDVPLLGTKTSYLQNDPAPKQ